LAIVKGGNRDGKKAVCDNIANIGKKNCSGKRGTDPRRNDEGLLCKAFAKTPDMTQWKTYAAMEKRG